MRRERYCVVVYACLNADREVIYVGGTADLHRRVIVHRSQTPWWREVADVASMSIDARDRWHIERAVIQHFRPVHNVNGLLAPATMPVAVRRWCASVGLDSEAVA